MDRFLLKVESLLKHIVVFLNGAMLLWVFAQVITRYFFSYTPSFGEELARYMFVWVVFLSLPIVARIGGHMAIEAVTLHLRGNALRFSRILAECCTAIFLLIMVWQGIQMMVRVSFQTSPALEISMAYVYMVIPFGCLVMLLNVLNSLTFLIFPRANETK